MPQHIHCSVSNCHYWSQGNICQANEILVTSDSIGATMPDSFDAHQSNTLETTPVGTCMETCCKSFVEKGSPHIKEDKIKKQ